MSVLDAIEEANNIIAEAVNELPRVRATEIGLDSHAGSVFVDVDNELIITPDHNIRNLEYYGGFEYVMRDASCSVGDFKIYGIEEDSRVEHAIEFYKQNHPTEEE